MVGFICSTRRQTLVDSELVVLSFAAIRLTWRAKKFCSATKSSGENAATMQVRWSLGPDGNLYIGTGDNTNPFNDSEGFAPIDEREGREPWDAQRSSGNTKSYNGKILRIRPEPNGTYSILTAICSLKMVRLVILRSM